MADESVWLQFGAKIHVEHTRRCSKKLGSAICIKKVSSKKSIYYDDNYGRYRIWFNREKIFN